MEKKLSKLELRKEIKRRKPIFTRQDSNKLMNRTGWRRPKGLHSKLRLGFRGHGKKVEPGYGSPREAKYLHRTGLKMVKVCSLSDLAKIDPKTEGIVVSSSTGMRKTVEILKEAKKKSITVLNLKIDVYLKNVEDIMKARKEKKNAVIKRKEDREKKIKPKKEEKKEEISEEEKKEQEKKELDKALTKKGAL